TPPPKPMQPAVALDAAGIIPELGAGQLGPAKTAAGLSSFFMDRAEAVALVRSRAEKETTVRHLITVEGVMRRLAVHFGEDPDTWGLVGLFHDIDQDQTHGDLERHARVGAGWHREAGVGETIVNAVLAHAHEQYRT